MAMVLQQALRGLCYKSGWTYAVFWKLKRRSRMVLTWEDGFYEFSKITAVSSFDAMQPSGGYLMMNNGDASVPTVPGSEDELGLAVARMSYHVYSLGEGIIGRVAFTGKHQWVFGERGSTGEGTGPGRSGRAINEKYPAGWQQQFAAGIKTIAVVAVPQGVVQLGSTQIVMEDLTLVSHVRTLFGTLQSVPGAFLSDYVPESQGRVATHCSMVMTVPMMMPMGGANDNTRGTTLGQMHAAQMNMSNMSQVPTTAVGTSSYDMMNLCKPTMPIRAHLRNPFLPSPINPLNPLSLRTSRIMPSAPMNKDPPARNQSLLSTVSMAVGNRQGVLNNPFTNVSSQASGPTAFDASSTDSPTVPPLVPRNWNCPAPIPPLLQSKVGTLFDRTMQSDHGRQHQLQSSLSLSGTSASQVTLVSTSVPLQSISTSVPSVLKVGGADCKPSHPYGQESYGTAESCRTGPFRESPQKASEFTTESIRDTKGPREQNQLYTRSPVEVAHVQTMKPNSDVEMAFKSPSLKGPAESLKSHGGQWSPNVTHGKSQAESLDVSRTCMSEVNKFVHTRNLATYCQPGEEENVRKETLVQSSQGFGDVAGFSNRSALISKVAGSGMLGIEESTDGRRMVDVCSEIGSKVWNENPKSDWDCFSALLGPFPIGDELSQALRPGSSREGDRDPFSNMHPHHASVDTMSNSTVQNLGDTQRSSDVSVGKDIQSLTVDYDIFKAVSEAVLMDSRSEPLLEAVVAGVSNTPLGPSVQSSSEVDSSCHDPLSGTALPREPGSLLQRNGSCRARSSGDTLEYDPATEVSPCKGDMEFEKLFRCGIEFQTENIYKVPQNPLKLNGDEGYSRSDDELGPYDSILPAKRQEDSGKVGSSRKKAKHGDSLRPRPKDRQQIQDRVRELRQIVPNACKCSIDSLLERTIKHMHFLQSVTQYGGKWKRLGDLKEDADFPVEDSKTCPNLQDVTENVENGDNFALKFGKLNSGCPIVVENLNCPRQMLVEMLCEERVLFLEIADTVRGLGLTILKGAMESRSGKTWARFVVEAASRDIHRVEVLWNLMQLLQPQCGVIPSNDKPVNYTDPNCLYTGALDSTSSSLSPSLPHTLRRSIPLQMTAR